MSAPTIPGRKIVLSDGREVWAGHHDGSWYIELHNGKGDIHRVRLSDEAADALVNLLTGPKEDSRWVQLIESDAAPPPAQRGEP